ncbi:hypothetical protein AB0E56_03235 [Microbacterium sp. NPDC028030]|uniref:hypothetical protein n=1 Tax=Microbacterium sp. NPDC028030 TaxID=3155124 RepID=UPI00340A1E86
MRSATSETRKLYGYAGRILSSEQMFIEVWIQNQDVPMPEEEAEHARQEARIVPIMDAWSHVTSEWRQEYAEDMWRHLSEGRHAEWVVMLDGRPVAYRFAA